VFGSKNVCRYVCKDFSMRRSKKPYNFFQLASAIFMIAALLWLTVSTPFVFQFQQKQIEQNKIAQSEQSPVTDTNEEESNPFGNTTEEKNSTSSNTLTEEYLHELHLHNHFFSIVSSEHQCHHDDTYIAFHGELDVPPPDVA
jgi:cytoskeletal protein RodZ